MSEWTEIHANDDTFHAHLADEEDKAPLVAVVGVCAKITCRCWRNPDAQPRQILAGFGTPHHNTVEASVVSHPRADRASPV